jgi:hypothetical protein
MFSVLRVPYVRRMYSLDIKRCRHCVGHLVAIRLEEHEEFEAPGPVVLCTYCDASPHADRALFVPQPWSDPLH